ncbi:Aste57867_14647 [Aphanomyces stellatus]|uniref:Aste57867_14647 protein n=1 Tax=Aphanomyces stellatus TaxID=120398 RepID=A0A485L261_9STRA|nr:hypothetical protein As57867_014592 [Aphanomyces stellatus]VFT91466.1 Aste57867_14647 [Aphanomyces stellatus]
MVDTKRAKLGEDSATIKGSDGNTAAAWSVILPFLPRHEHPSLAMCSSSLSRICRRHHSTVQADISNGQEPLPIPVQNDVDDELYPTGFAYLTSLRSRVPLPPPLPRHARVQVFKHKSKGWSLRATTPIPAQTFVGEYVGRLVGTQAMDRSSTYIVSIREEAEDMIWRTNVDARDVGNFTRFINHACVPNARWDTYRGDGPAASTFCPRIHVLSLRDIHAGEEITVDYGVACGVGATPCGCGSIKCRGFLPFDRTL